jgi:hypothetical protein
MPDALTRPPLIPAQAGIQSRDLRGIKLWLWVTACAGTNG